MPAEPAAGEAPGNGRQVAEFIFIIVVAAISLAALLAALSYDIISALAPLCILVPLLILVAIQLNRTRKVAHLADVNAELRRVFTGQRQRFRAIAALTGWMALLLATIFVAGHYAGMFLFLLIMLCRISAESWRMTLIVSVLTTAAIYVLFEYVFNLELYRGLIFNLVASALA
ncbi:MAG TPA: tripartite tricarboxylate transporter TctB family protein [Woeseiaceae bacterium]|nr:tripartite tricarboxylate transporter TctB family protein [Woeseiaceae bacterium]